MLQVKNLCKTFIVHILGGKKIDAIRDVSFNVEAGQFVGISGPSGSGKSSVLKCIHRTYLPSSGAVVYRSENGPVNLAAATERRVIELRRSEIAYVSQFLRVVPRVSALDVVAEPLYRRGIGVEEGRGLARELLRLLNIPEYLHDAYPSTFSGGEQQRVNIARAVIGRPRLLLLDEPTASLDKDSERRVLDLLANLKSQQMAMVGIFHDPDIMRSACDNIYYLKN